MNISYNVQVNGAVEVSGRSSTGEYYTSDWYTFEALAGQTVVITLWSSAFQPVIYLSKADGAQIATDTGKLREGRAYVPNTYFARIPHRTGAFTLPVTGTYSIEATGVRSAEHPEPAFRSAVTGGYKLLLEGTQPAVPVRRPAAPSELTASAITSDQVDLQWTDNSADEEAFEVICLNGTEWIVVQTVGADTTAVTIADLTAETTYQFSVRAINANGISDMADPIELTTEP